MQLLLIWVSVIFLLFWKLLYRNQFTQLESNYREFKINSTFPKYYGCCLAEPEQDNPKLRIQKHRFWRNIYKCRSEVLLLILFSVLTFFLNKRNKNKSLRERFFPPTVSKFLFIFIYMQIR